MSVRDETPWEKCPVPGCRILLVEDDALEARVLARVLTSAGYEVEHAYDGASAVERLGRSRFELVLCDLGLPDLDGMELLRRQRGPFSPAVVVVTGNAEVATAVEAMRHGAADYLTKPFVADLLLEVVHDVVASGQRRKALVHQHEPPSPIPRPRSPAMRRAVELAEQLPASSLDAAMLVGENGSGRTVLAGFIHRSSPRSQGPFVQVDFRGIPADVLDAHLFGSEGEPGSTVGAFAVAIGGTLVLRGVESLSSGAQMRLLRAIETRRFFPSGAVRERFSDPAVLTVITPEGREALQRGRADLFYRLAPMEIEVPPLRHRPEDVMPLAEELWNAALRARDLSVVPFDDAARRALADGSWPGNVSELKHAVERLIDSRVSASGEDLSRPPAGDPAWVDPPPEPLEQALHRAEGAHIRRTLRYARGDLERAAEQLGIGLDELRAAMARHKLG